MGLKKALFNIKGMTRDLAASKFSPEFAYENRNMRLAAVNEDSDTLVLTNEIGPLHLSNLSISGTPIGQASIDNSIILFTTKSGETELETYVGGTINLSGCDFSSVKFYSSKANAINNNNGTAPVFQYSKEHSYSLYMYYAAPSSVQSTLRYVACIDVTGRRFIAAASINHVLLLVKHNNSITICSVSSIVNNRDLDSYTKGVIQGSYVVKEDYIYNINVDNYGQTSISQVFTGDLNFNTLYPIESISLYEDQTLKKVYWTDGLNQPRVINIYKYYNPGTTPNDNFDFTRKVTSGGSLANEEVTIVRNSSIGGSFAPGVVQYTFTYYSLNGQETNIFYQSPLYYVSYDERGASAEESVGVSFSISITNYNSKFDYIRVYCTQRTSIDGAPIARKVVDLGVPRTSGETIYFVDHGAEGETTEASDLLFKNSVPITAGTFAQKDNTLFLGDIRKVTTDVISDYLSSTIRSGVVDTLAETLRSVSSDNIMSGTYTCINNLSRPSTEIKTFKKYETYRFGLQAQDMYGVWSKPVWIKDFKFEGDCFPTYANYNVEQGNPYTYKLLACQGTISSNLVSSLKEAGYIKVRPLVVYPSSVDREVICQGVLCPTVYNVSDRYNNSPTVMSSWFFRPNAPYSIAYDVDNRPSTGTGWTYDAVKTPVMSNHRATIDINETSTVINEETVNKGKWAEFRHNKPIPSNIKGNAEIQCISNPPDPYLGYLNRYDYYESGTPGNWVADNSECFFVDQSIVTLHSPDIEFNTEVSNMDLSNAKLRIVGKVPISTSISDINILTSTPPLNYRNGTSNFNDLAPGFFKEKVSTTFGASEGYGWKSALSGVYWLDEFYGSSDVNNKKLNVGFVIYPWHRAGSLNNTRSVASDESRTAMLYQKKMSILRWSYRTAWLSPSNVWFAYEEDSPTATGISGVKIFDSNENTIIKLPAPEHSNLGDITYGGNVDKIVSFHTKGKNKNLDSDTDINDDTNTSSFYPIVAAYAVSDTSDENIWISGGESQHSGEAAEEHNFKTFNSHALFGNPYGLLKRRVGSSLDKYVSDGVQSCSNDPVYMKYKSTPHAVIALNYTEGRKQRLLPSCNNTNAVGNSYCCPSTYSNPLFWDPNYNNNNYKIQGAYQDNIQSITDTAEGYLWLAELYNDNITAATRFGGQTSDAFEKNLWLPCGGEVNLLSIEAGNSATITWSEGDTYYQRYDCLKTYPYTMEDQNSVVDILSFMVETRINLDGRYDKNRGQPSNLYMSPKNFNLINPVYSQKNNFFNYRGIDTNKSVITVFPNTITWTKTKTLGEDIDTWTDINLASTLDLDGDLGQIRAIRRFKDSLLTFQDSGISQILYNESVQISSATGVPIEIANSGKVSGKRYISDKIGCLNKWSICSTPNGIYFNDDLSRDIFLYNGEFTNLSDKLGFHSWAYSTLTNKIWNPKEWGNCIIFYDKLNKDVLFITANNCLAFSEKLGYFTSFYDYGGTPIFGNANNKEIIIHKTDSSGSTYGAYLFQQGYRNNFFGEYKPFSTTVVVNQDPTSDKIFNNLEYRADGFTLSGVYQKDYSFDTLRTWNEYQEGTSTLVNTIDRPSTLKKKFRVWRANIPRWNVNKNGQTANGRDRMRNPWLYVKLSMENTSNLNSDVKMVLHDLVVDYFE